MQSSVCIIKTKLVSKGQGDHIGLWKSAKIVVKHMFYEIYAKP
jgi:hypothetical protein